MRAAMVLILWLPLARAIADEGERVEPHCTAIRTRYAIHTDTAPSFPVKCRFGAIEGAVASPGELQPYLDFFADEFCRYPPELIARTKLKRVVFCKRLAFDGQLRNAIPDYEHDALYYDVSRGNHSRNYQRSVIHHEFFHVIDYQDDGDVYRDERWAKMLPLDFRYGRGGRGSQNDSKMSLFDESVPGFLTHYSTTGVEEDKAELFAHMIINPAYVAERSAKEPLLQAKVDRMKSLLSEFCPEMNAGFWRETERRALSIGPAPAKRP